jgi:hypothetical protein
MSYYIRYFAENPVSLKALGAALKSLAPDYKIDGGDLMRGQDVLAEVAIDSAGSDLFNEDMSYRLDALRQVGGQAAQWVDARLRGTQSIIAVRIDPSVAWDLLGPLWPSMSSLATGLTQVDGQGYFDGSNLVLGMA